MDNEIEISSETVYHFACLEHPDYEDAWLESKKYPQGARFFKTENGIRVVPRDGQEILF